MGGSAPEATRSSSRPLLLIHSVNAAASAHEIKPLYDFYCKHRPTYAIDLPGYGHSERGNRTYMARTMVDALHAVIAEIRAEHDEQPIDALAVSLSCEFLGRAALESSEAIRSLALVSPTGFRRNSPTSAPPETSRGNYLTYRILTLPLLGRALFRVLTTTPVIRYFLQKTWGQKRIDEEMLRHSVQTARQTGARHAPFCFLSGYLFSADILDVYTQIAQPVWLSQGTRGEFSDYTRTGLISRKPNWQISVFETGTLPYFEVLESFIEAYEDFLERVASGLPVNPGAKTSPSG